MSKILRGKYLVRKTKKENGKDCLILVGVFNPINFKIDDINDNDEMWVSDIIISDGIRFTDPIENDGGSPEDFLEGNANSPKFWKNRTDL